MKNYWKRASFLFVSVLAAQSLGVLSVGPVGKLTGKRGEVAEVRVPVVLHSGYHVNSDTPSEPYLIPLRLTWEKGPLEVLEIVFPKPKMMKYDFSPKPISVFTGDFDIVTKFRISRTAQTGPGIILGKLRYQACSTTACLPPKNLEVRLPTQIR